MTWHAQLRLDYLQENQRAVARYQHEGPLRILQSLYPEGDAVCHNVLVHPPGGLVGGDTLTLKISVGPDAHGLLTTPGATRFYRSDGEAARQTLHATLGPGARMEWLPLEALAYSGCLAENHARFDLSPGAELIGWDLTAFGLPMADQPYTAGRFTQHLEMPGAWLERARVAADDARLMDGPLGLAGHRCMATLFFLSGSDLLRPRRDAALEMAREVLEAHALCPSAGATAPNGRVIVVRVLAPVVEPAMDLLRKIRAAWRTGLWQLPATAPRIWAM